MAEVNATGMLNHIPECAVRDAMLSAHFQGTFGILAWAGTPFVHQQGFLRASETGKWMWRPTYFIRCNPNNLKGKPPHRASEAQQLFIL